MLRPRPQLSKKPRRPLKPLRRRPGRARDMELKVTTLDGQSAGSVTVPDAIFGLEPRPDIIQRCVVWQLAKRRAGTHAVKNRADINRTGKKMYRQKGTGGARHGSGRVNIFRGGSSPSAAPALMRSRIAPTSTAPARKCIARRAPVAPDTDPGGSIFSVVAARQAPRRHSCGQESRRHQPHRQENVSPEGHRWRPTRIRAGQYFPWWRPRLRPDPAQSRNRLAEEGARARA